MSTAAAQSRYKGSPAALNPLMTRPPIESLPRSATADASSWYPVTTVQSVTHLHRLEKHPHSRKSDDHVNEERRDGPSTDDIASIRNMDKLEVFFKCVLPRSPPTPCSSTCSSSSK